jgi:hypothetical protein
MYDEYVYFGFVPSKIYIYRPEKIVGGEILGREFYLDEKSVRNEVELTIIGNHNDTKAKIYLLPECILKEDFVINKMEKRVFNLQNGTFFKVVTSKPVTVVLAGGEGIELGNDVISTFWTSTDGSFIGKEFIFQAFPGTIGCSYYIYALEDSNVKLLDENFTEVSKYNLKHNEVKNLGIILANKRIYRIVSTGSIMLNSFSDSRSYFFPSLEGSFLGKIFYGIADATPGDVWDDWKFLLINTLNDTKIKIFDLEFNRLYTEFNFPAGKNCSLN